MEQNVIYSFGKFRLHTDTQLLWDEREGRQLQSKVYQLLLYFLQNSGRLVSRKELFNSVWQGRVVEDASLRLAVNNLRKALHDVAKNPYYISTICKRGYRFMPIVTIEAGSPVNTSLAKITNISPRQAMASADIGSFDDVELLRLIRSYRSMTLGRRHICSAIVKRKATS